MQDLEGFKSFLSSPKKGVIIPHAKPDGDALGSCLAWYHFLLKKGHEVKVISPTDYPAFLKWMKGQDEVLVYEDGGEAEAEKLVKEAEVVYCLDFNDLKRINGLGELVEKCTAKKVMVDHHQEPTDFADFTFSDTRYAATCEMIYELIVELDGRDLVDQDMAEELYAGIMTDTGGFKHSNTTKKTHTITADLIDLKADTAKIGKYIYDANSLDRLRFLGFALSQRLQVLPEYRTAFFAITAEDLKKFNEQTGDTEGFVNYALSMREIVFAAMIIQRKDGIKMSFRSKGTFDASVFAKANFNGGGHKNAAGGISDLEDIEGTVEKFTNLLPAYKEELLNAN
ncbi:bifunctional oligoribonuclease/PAP phosphatase NrnA [Persicobacter sp. CCB-QB2]|uniref:DHH family phosphoesterase n=1 Tax=Persicobacter sp. CCB-QB2 TaxID=1561025 RepID=UPI0006A97B83|nr:DHH family phosphoesterase [Persicobacter sp. CCB-QB2]